MSDERRKPGLMRWVLSLILVAMFGFTAMGQTATSTIKGKVMDQNGAPVAGVEVNAVDMRSGYVRTVRTGSDGAYLMPGLKPSDYRIVLSAPGYQTGERELTLLVGRSPEVNFRLSPSATMSEEITVIGQVPVEMETSEITTNISRQQIEQLPQNNRNFMNFAALAPGVTISDDELRKTFQAGAQDANAVNVFIDGISYKNDVIQGGVVGQDSSRGNPFPQNAVQEFKVLTQNYSAEYQKASSAIISAVTKSGSNTLDGQVFLSYQDEALVADNPINGSNPAFERLQSGLSVGGPIQRDRMHYFLSYEGNDQNRNEVVSLGSGGNPEIRQMLSQYTGEFPSDFGLDLFFGKLSFQMNPSSRFDLSGFVRNETDVRGFGGQTSYQSSEEIANDVSNLGLTHNWTGTSWFNEASVGYQTYEWNPRPLNGELIGQNYFDVLRVGGRDTEQDISQDRTTLKDDLTFAPMNMAGSHEVKVGANVELLDYVITKDFTGNPVYNYRSNEDWQFPFEARYGLGDPTIKGDNTEIGLYVQDEWRPIDRLNVNLGIRWDYESNMFPTDWVTPPDIVNKFSSIVNAEQYFTDGNDRSAIDDMFAPRLGISYDVMGDAKSVVFGGWGRYYDRILFNNSLDERFRQQHTVGQFLFSEQGGPLPDGRMSAKWEDKYLTEAGLQELLALGITGLPEVFLIENDTQAPYTDQWTIGTRHEFSSFVGTLSYANQQSYNGFTFGWGHRNADGSCCRWSEVQSQGYAAIITSQDDKRTWYEAIYLSLDKPFTAGTRWAGGLAWTHALTAEGIGGDLFSFDFPTVEDYPRRPLNNIQDDRLVANGIVRLPYDFEFGTVLTYGSGLHYNIVDRSAGTGPAEVIRRGEGEGDSYLTLDLRLGYDFHLAQTAVGLVLEAFNITNDEIYSGWDATIFTLPAVNPNFGKPNSIVAGSQRRYQYGVRFSF